MSEAAVEFLKNNGRWSLVSLGCGTHLNRMDNHVKLFVHCGLRYYVGIDRVAKIEVDPDSAFSDPLGMNDFLASRQKANSGEFFDRVKVFPGTCVEEMHNIVCQVVVCQRVLPFRHWEKIIASMKPLLILQEDLRGCELQEIDTSLYERTFPGIAHYQLMPFNPIRFLPIEQNMVLWRRKDFFTCQEDCRPWWQKRLFRFYRHRPTTPFSQDIPGI